MSERPVLVPREDGKWELAEAWEGIPAGFVTDGGSIPRFFWRVVGAPVEAKTIGAYLKHDWAYKTGCKSREKADKELFADLRAAGVGYLRAKTIYLAVRACGWIYYNNETQEDSKMKKLVVIAVLAALVGCKSVKVETGDWSASYTSVFQANDVKGLAVEKKGENVTVKAETIQSALDAAAQDALRSAAAALEAAAKACAAVAK